jgi:hypothetical protein
MAVFRNDFGEDRVVPTLGWHAVPAGETVTVPDEEIEHWVAGGWVPADPATAKAAKAAAEARAAAFEALTAAPAAEPAAEPAVATAKPTKSTAPEGTEQ